MNRLATFAIITLAAVAGAMAAPKTEAPNQVNAFIAHAKKVGVDQAIKDANTAPEWKRGGMNLMVTDVNGRVLASSLNEKLVGKETLETKDPTGKEFVKESLATAKRGEGWVEYQFINPATKKLEDRVMFVKRLPGFDGFVGIGVTKN